MHGDRKPAMKVQTSRRYRDHRSLVGAVPALLPSILKAGTGGLLGFYSFGHLFKVEWIGLRIIPYPRKDGWSIGIGRISIRRVAVVTVLGRICDGHTRASA